ncbi:hypothetical protein [Streptomyces avidinii]|uniref:hypothetical protein n=1 Tax=Streptomyces avidinii TaxID=1895 RepID=UPI00386B76B2
MSKLDVTAIPPQPNVNDPAVYEWYHAMRDEHPVHQDPVTGWWVAYRYADARHVLTHPEIFSSQMHRMGFPETGLESLPQMDPPRHTRVRQILSTAFTPHSISGFEPQIIRTTNEIIDGFIGKDSVDLVAELAYTVPIAVILEILGLPAEDRHLFYHWARKVMNVTPEEMAQEGFAEALGELQQEAVSYLREKVRERRNKPGDEMLTRLSNAELDGDRLTEDETVNFANVMFAGGHISTTMTIANSVDLLDLNPRAMAEVEGLQELLVRQPVQRRTARTRARGAWEAADGRSTPPVSVNYVRVPGFVSGVLLLVWWPLILERVGHYTAATALPADGFLARWLLITAALFAASAMVLIVRTWGRSRAQRQARSATK